jgi:predicted small lipoprotein YifL
MLNINSVTFKRVLLVLLLGSLSACAARYPLGIPEEQWVLLTPQQQLDARSQQAALDQASQARREAEARAREAEAIKEAAELDQRRRDAGYGERVQCILESAEGYIRGRWEPVRPLAMDLVSGYPIELTLSDTRNRYQQSMYAGFDGQVVRLCRSTNNCVEMAATRQQLQRGISQYLEQDRLLRGTLYCDLVPQAPPGQRLKAW